MKIRSKKLLFAAASSVCFCLLVFCTPVAASESDEAAEPVNAAATDTQGNRDLNQGDDSDAPESSE